MPGASADTRAIATLAGLGVAVRGVLLLLAGDLEPFADESHYLFAGSSWSHFGVYVDQVRFLWPPGYPFVVSLAIDLFGAAAPAALRVLQVALSAVVGVSLMMIARELFTALAMRIAGALWAVYLPLAAYTHYLWPETVFLAFFLPALLLLVQWWRRDGDAPGADARLIAAGLLLGLSLYFKELLLYLGLLLVVAVVWRLRQRGVAALLAGALLATSMAVVVLPLALRNREVYGRAALAATLGKNVMMGVQSPYQSTDYLVDDRARIYQANAPMLRSVLGLYVAQTPRPALTPQANLIDRQSAYAASGLALVFEQPGFMIRSRIMKLANFAAPTSFFFRHHALGRYEGAMGSPGIRRPMIALSLILTLVVMAGAVPGFFWSLRGSPAWLLIAMVVLYLIAAGAPIHGASRYRVPLEPLMIVLCAGFLAGVGRPWLRDRTAWVSVAVALLLLAALWVVTALEVGSLLGMIW